MSLADRLKALGSSFTSLREAPCPLDQSPARLLKVGSAEVMAGRERRVTGAAK
jgi:hypothetical protein